MCATTPGPNSEWKGGNINIMLCCNGLLPLPLLNTQLRIVLCEFGKVTFREMLAKHLLYVSQKLAKE